MTTVLVVRPSTRGRATLVSTGVTRPSQRDDSQGVTIGTATLGRGRLPIAIAIRSNISA